MRMLKVLIWKDGEWKRFNPSTVNIPKFDVLHEGYHPRCQIRLQAYVEEVFKVKGELLHIVEINYTKRGERSDRKKF